MAPDETKFRATATTVGRWLDHPFLGRLGSLQTLVWLVLFGYGLARHFHLVGGSNTLSTLLVVVGVAGLLVNLLRHRPRSRLPSTTEGLDPRLELTQNIRDAF